jgi:hypothetical protein
MAILFRRLLVKFALGDSPLSFSALCGFAGGFFRASVFFGGGESSRLEADDGLDVPVGLKNLRMS